MSRKDYRMIAAWVRALNNETNFKAWIENVASDLKRDNANFDKEKFYDACGYYELLK